MKVERGARLWLPSDEFAAASNMSRFMDWLRREKSLEFRDYDALWSWSVRDIEGFWSAVWQYFGVKSATPYQSVLSGREMPGAQWFPGARVNFAEHLLAVGGDEEIAVQSAGEGVALHHLTRAQLRSAVRACATSLREMGVKPGDRVVAYVANVPDALVAFLATTSIGAVWSSCSPDFGAATVIDRFAQVSPDVLIATDAYLYGGKVFDRVPEVARLVAALPTVKHVIHLPGFGTPARDLVPGAVPWSSLLAREPVPEGGFRFEPTPFDHPLWIVYSSGTTGLPKPFVHGHGGILLEALKLTHFHFNLRRGSCMFFHTTTGWVMWNILFSALLTGASILVYDGNPGHPDRDQLWRLAERAGVTMFGTSPAFINQQIASGARPGRDFDLRRIDSMLVAGSPVTPEHMLWCYENVGADLWLTTQSGGTDVATAFVGASPTLPVHAGEIQARCLGVDACAYDEQGRELVGEVGELVIRQPMPSMPLRFWNDPGDTRYRESYFENYPGVWRHGDYIEFNVRGGSYISGRSDATLNRHGVRIGTAEIYRLVESLDEVADSLVVNLDLPGGHSFMPLFVVLRDGKPLDATVEQRIRTALRTLGSPRHVPDRILQVDAVPVTLTGKKLEVPVRRILLGHPAERVASRDAMANPSSLEFFVEYAATQRDYVLGPASRSERSSSSS